MEWIQKNTEWLFSGIGILIVGLFWKSIMGIFKRFHIKVSYNHPNHTDKISLNYVEPNLDTLKRTTNILFIDDDKRFKVVNLLRESGWINTKTVIDISNYDEKVVLESQILFIDIQGVGKILKCPDEGLGLAKNLKSRYPGKKVIIYSAETQGERFHEALRKVDTFLPKNAELLEFQSIIEEYAKELYR